MLYIDTGKFSHAAANKIKGFYNLTAIILASSSARECYEGQEIGIA